MKLISRSSQRSPPNSRPNLLVTSHKPRASAKTQDRNHLSGFLPSFRGPSTSSSQVHFVLGPPVAATFCCASHDPRSISAPPHPTWTISQIWGLRKATSLPRSCSSISPRFQKNDSPRPSLRFPASNLVSGDWNRFLHVPCHVPSLISASPSSKRISPTNRLSLGDRAQA